MSSPQPYLCLRCCTRLTRPPPRSALNRLASSSTTPRSRAASTHRPLRRSGLHRPHHRLLSTTSSLSQLTPHKLPRTDPNLLPSSSPPAAETPSSTYRTVLLHRPPPSDPQNQTQIPEQGEEGEGSRTGPEEGGQAGQGIDITARATRRLQQIMRKEGNPRLCLRVSVESGGCHGFQYVLSLIDGAAVVEGEDYVFCSLAAEQSLPPSSLFPRVGVSEAAKGAVENEDGDWRAETEGLAKVVMDEPSLELLAGSRVDYTTELIGSQFKVENPRASSSCGCGTSFDVKA